MKKAYDPYEPGTYGHILGVLAHRGIPMRTIEQLAVGVNKISLNGVHWANYRYEDGCNFPAFHFIANKAYNDMSSQIRYLGLDQYEVRIYPLLSIINDKPYIRITANQVTNKGYDAIMGMLCDIHSSLSKFHIEHTYEADWREITISGDSLKDIQGLCDTLSTVVFVNREN